MFKFFQRCSFVRYMRYDYYKAPKWLRKFYDFCERRINFLLNWRWYKIFPFPTYFEIDGVVYNAATDYYIDFLEMPREDNYGRNV